MNTRYVAVTAIALLLATARAARAEDWKTECNVAIASTMVDTVNSGTTFPGDRFRFKTTAAVKWGALTIPAGTLGYGFVREVTAASNRDRNGSLVLELRSIYVGPREVQVIGDPRESTVWAPAATTVERATGYLPIPGLLRTAVNEVRDGKNVSIGPGFKFNVIPFSNPRDGTPCRKVILHT